MSTLDGSTEAALAAPVVTVAGMIRMDVPGHTVRLCDGSAVINVGGDPYTGEDSVFGVIGGISQVDSGVGDSAPALDVSFLPPSTSALAEISSPAFQGSRVRMSVAVVDPDAGTVVGSPQQVFFGLIDTCAAELARGVRSATQQWVSGFDRLFANQEGQRLADTFHQNIWPGELGLSNVTGITVKDAWGTAGPNSGAFYGGGRTYYGGEDRVREN